MRRIRCTCTPYHTNKLLSINAYDVRYVYNIHIADDARMCSTGDMYCNFKIAFFFPLVSVYKIYTHSLLFVCAQRPRVHILICWSAFREKKSFCYNNKSMHTILYEYTHNGEVILCALSQGYDNICII